MQPAPHRPRRPARLRTRAILTAAIATLLPALPSPATTVSWAVNSNGLWTSALNWSTHALPGPADDVTIDRPTGTYTVTLSSGAQSINSLLSNENLLVSAGTLAVSTTAQIGGALTLTGGALGGGTWSTTGAGTLSATGGTLSGLTLASNFSLPSGTLTVTNGLTLPSSTLAISSPGYYPTLSFTGAQTLAGSGTVLFNYSGSILAPSGGLTVAPAITVANGSGSSNISLGSYGLNQGTILSPTSGEPLGVTGGNWTNAGTLAASNGGTLRIDSDAFWTNSGTISIGAGSSATLGESWSNTGALSVATGGKLTLGGSFTASSLGSLVNNGSVSITGTLANTGHTLTLDRSIFTLAGGTVLGGTVDTTAAGATASGTLSGVTLAGAITAAANSGLTFNNNLTLAGATLALAPSGFYSFLSANGPQTLAGTGSILFNGGASISSNGYLTLGPGISISTAGPSSSGTISLGSYSLNQGTISSQVAGRGITVTGTNWTNAGTLAASNGGTLTLSGSWSNTGSLNVGAGSTAYVDWPSYTDPWSNTGSFNVAAGGTLYLGGSFTTPSLAPLNNSGSVGITGSLDNTGHTLTLSGSALSLSAGTITGGTVDTTPAGATAYGTLDGVTLAGTLNVIGTLTMTNGLTLAGGTLALQSTSNLPTLRVSPGTSQTLSGTGTILFGTGGTFTSIIDSTYGTLTIASGITVANGSSPGWVLLGPAGVNQGAISSRVPGKTVVVGGGNWTNAGVLAASNGGTLSLNGSWSNTGTVSIAPASTLVFSNGTTPNGAIDLSGNAVVNYTTSSPAGTIRQQLALGRAGSTGIILPESSTDPTRAIGYAEASLLLNLSGSKTATWSGQTVDATTLLLKPTLQGDANLDGVLNADDYALLDRSFALSLANPHWTDGDFNYDGVVNQNDYLLIDSTYLKAQGSFPGSLLAQRDAQFGAAYVAQLLTSIPEPCSLAACGLALLATSTRRRRPHSHTRFPSS